jgi:hypothetical protein
MEAHYLYHHRPDDGGSTYLLERDYTALHLRKLSRSNSPRLEPEISHGDSMLLRNAGIYLRVYMTS